MDFLIVCILICFISLTSSVPSFDYKVPKRKGDRIRVEVECQHPFGVYRDPDDCSKYYQCHNNVPSIHHQCPPGTEFSEEFNFCHWAAQVKCSFDPDQDEYEYDELSEVPEISPVVAEGPPESEVTDEFNVLYPGCDCSGDVGDDGRGDCSKNWCYVEGDSKCNDTAPSTYMQGWSWSHKACLGRTKSVGCDCNGKLFHPYGPNIGKAGNEGRGECLHHWCYVSPESTCRDMQPSSQVYTWKWSYEACRAPPVRPRPPPVISEDGMGEHPRRL